MTGRTTAPDRVTATDAPAPLKDQAVTVNSKPRHTPRPAQLWLDGFHAGAADALRRASREVDDPDVWALLDRIAENYACTEMVTYDGRTAARTTEQASDLQPIDAALTFTGIAAEIRDLTRRRGDIE